MKPLEDITMQDLQEDKRLVLELCEKIWRWLSENPTYQREGMDYVFWNYKEDWPGWQELKSLGDEPSYYFECFCCMHVTFDGLCGEGPKCQKCPLLDHWLSGAEEKWNGKCSAPCTNRGSSFQLWEDHNDKEKPEGRALHARRIADACLEQLKEMVDG